MSRPLVDDVLEDAAAEAPPALAPLDRPAWAARLAVAAVLFIATGLVVVVAAVFANPLRNADVLSAGVTLVVAGAVLRSITSAAGN